MRSGTIRDIRERLAFLAELGVDGLGVGDLAMLVENTGSVTNRSELAAVQPEPPAIGTIIRHADFQPPSVRDAARDDAGKTVRRSILGLLPSLAKMELPEVRRSTEVASLMDLRVGEPSASIEPGASLTISDPDISMETLQQIRDDIGHDCTRCKLAGLGRKQVVNSVGDPEAELMFVGEAPGADEDEKGEPFVGRAGQLLTDIIEKGLEMPRADVFIGNINRCRPPKNRAPEPDESTSCKPFLIREIAVVRPKVIVVLGATAAQNLLETKTPIGQLRGRFHDWNGVKVMPTFHPAYLLRDPNKKREVWEDMKIVKAYLRELQNEK